jgi:hypothetical protein
LRDLRALKKPHWSWSLPDFALTQPDERVFEVARIMGSACLQGEYATPQQVATCVKLCHAMLASIGINLKPYHNLVPDGASPLFAYPDELSLLARALTMCRHWLDQANESKNTDVKVGVILLDSERFYRKDDDPAWNAAITERYNEVYDLCKSIFPGVRVEWYERGIEASQSETGWSPAPWNVFDNKADSFSCDLYRVSEITEMRETFRRTYDFAATKVVNPEVTPWVALGSGYFRNFDFQEWKSDWDYPTIYSWMLGRELHDHWFGDRPQRFAPWNAAKCCVFYHNVFDSRSPSALKHFVAYVRGSHDIKSLPT